MEELSVNPGRCRVHGNIIGRKYGYLETLDSFQSHKCQISKNTTESDAYDIFDVYSFTLTKNENLTNLFNDNIAYCSSTTIDAINSWLYVCEHFNTTFDPIESVADIETFTNGYKLIIKDDYIDANTNQDNTAPFHMLIHQAGTGVSIPNNVSRITYSCSYAASPNISSIKVGFVFFDTNHNYISSVEAGDIANVGTGNRGRCNASTTNIPNNAKYVSVEFSFPDGVGRYTNSAGNSINDYFIIELNCLLFNSQYGGFVKNG